MDPSVACLSANHITLGATLPCTYQEVTSGGCGRHYTITSFNASAMGNERASVASRVGRELKGVSRMGGAGFERLSFEDTASRPRSHGARRPLTAGLQLLRGRTRCR
jgi:hypothetical protein